MNVQKRIKKLMDDRNWTEYRLCKESGLASSTITNMFRRNNAPTLPTLEAICHAFGLTLSQFFSEGDEIDLSDEQKHLLSRWGSLTDIQRELLLGLMETM